MNNTGGNKGMKRTALAVAFVVLSAESANAAPAIIKCTRQGVEPITIDLEARRQFGTTLHCIYGDFQLEGEMCAPHRGYGLNRPTGIPEVVDVAWRWQDAANWIGGATWAQVSNTDITFVGHGEGWKFSVDRTSGIGRLKTNADAGQEARQRAGRYICKKQRAVL